MQSTEALVTTDCPDCKARQEADKKRSCPYCGNRWMFYNLGIDFTVAPMRVRDWTSRQCKCGWKEKIYDDGEVVYQVP